MFLFIRHSNNFWKEIHNTTFVAHLVILLELDLWAYSSEKSIYFINLNSPKKKKVSIDV